MGLDPCSVGCSLWRIRALLFHMLNAWMHSCRIYLDKHGMLWRCALPPAKKALTNSISITSTLGCSTCFSLTRGICQDNSVMQLYQSSFHAMHLLIMFSLHFSPVLNKAAPKFNPSSGVGLIISHVANISSVIFTALVMCRKVIVPMSLIMDYWRSCSDSGAQMRFNSQLMNHAVSHIGILIFC